MPQICFGKMWKIHFAYLRNLEKKKKQELKMHATAHLAVRNDTDSIQFINRLQRVILWTLLFVVDG